ncbi:YdeI/OmpD-associated family protein [Oryzobacter terrae]|uniref:YdeI/OmpD-associated family protein n=1 Tax=Oryzobacter terrae TaxID=1620385 RepID=UPI00366D9E9C
MDFTAPLQATGGTTTGFVVPDALVDELGAGRRPKVVATLGTHTWRTSIAAMGGQFWLGVSAANREAAGVAAGETHTVTVEVDTAPRTVEVPDDLAAALTAAPAAAAGWDRLTFSARRAHAEAVLGAKRPETRARRIEAVVAALTG